MAKDGTSKHEITIKLDKSAKYTIVEETGAILKNGKIVPGTDQSKTDFDLGAYKAVFMKLPFQSVIEFLQNLEKSKTTPRKVKQVIYNAFQEAMGGTIENFFKVIQTDLVELQDFLLGVMGHDTPEALWDELEQLSPYIEKELTDPAYNGDSFGEIAKRATTDQETLETLTQLINKARIIVSQNTGRENRRQLRARAEERGAVMEIRGGVFPIFSERDLWDAFAPGKISRLGTLSPDEIDKHTGKVNKDDLDKGEVVSLNATDISYKTFMLLSAIVANSVDNFREEFVSRGSIEFYVKGVLETLDVDARICDDMQLNLDRKTAGVLYLEKQLEPLISFVGTLPGGSRYSVLNYVGYNVESDTMIIRAPYLYQLWTMTQEAYSGRKHSADQRIADGKRPLKKDLKPLEVNTLFKNAAYKEDDAVLEIATYITNVMLSAGSGTRTTEISYKTLISNCPRLREKLEKLEKLPSIEKLPNGKTRNNTKSYNNELKKISRAYDLLMNKEKCDMSLYFDILEIVPSRINEKTHQREFIAPTKSNINGKIVIKWKRDRNNT